MPETCETIKVVRKCDRGYIIINKSDMTKDDVEFKEKSKPGRKPAEKKESK